MVARKNAQTDAEKKTTLKAKQAAFLKAFTDCSFNVSAACRNSGVARRTVYTWKEDPKFCGAMEDAIEGKLDNLEQALYNRAMRESDSCLIFLAKCLLRGRGYVEGKEHGGKAVAGILEKVLAGELSPREAAYRINAMGLPLPEVLKIELSKAPPEEEDYGECPTADELEARAREAQAKYVHEREHFVPQRRAEVAQLKEELKHVESFSPQNSKGE